MKDKPQLHGKSSKVVDLNTEFNLDYHLRLATFSSEQFKRNNCAFLEYIANMLVVEIQNEITDQNRTQKNT